MPDDRTLLIAFEPQLKRMMAASQVDTALTKLLRQADTSKPAVAVLDFATVRPLAMLGLQNLPPLPPPFQPFLKVPRLVKWVEVSVDLAGELNIAAHIGAAKYRRGQGVERPGRASQDTRQFIEAQVAASMAGPQADPTQQALGKYMQRVVDKVIGGIEVRVADDQVEITLLKGAHGHGFDRHDGWPAVACRASGSRSRAASRNR